MSIESTVARNAVFLMVAEPARRLITLVTAMLMARYLAPAHFGIYSLAMAFIAISQVLTGFGANAYITREIAKDKSKAPSLAGAALVMRTFTFLITLCIVMAFLFAGRYDALKIEVIAIAFFGLLLMEWEGVCVSLFDGFQRMEFAALVAVIKTVVTLLAVLVTVASGWDVRAMMALINFAHVAGLLSAVYFTRKYLTHFHMRPKFRDVIGMAKAGAPFLTINVLWIITFHVDKIMLDRMMNEQAVGMYATAYRLFEVLITIPVLLSRAMYPAFSELVGTRDMDGMRSLFNKAMRLFGMVALPICTGLVLMGSHFIVLMFGKEYAPAGLTLSLFGCMLWMWFISTSCGWLLTALDRLKIVFAVNALVTFVNIAANLVLIPRYSFNGAALATGISEIVMMTFYLYFVHKELKVINFGMIPWKVILGATIMGAGLTYGIGVVTPLSLLAQVLVLVPSAAILYLASLYVLRAYGELEKTIAKKVMGKIFRR